MQCRNNKFHLLETSISSNNFFSIVLLILVYHETLVFSQSLSTEQLSFSVSENATAGTVIGTLPATSAGPYLALGEPENVFRDYIDVGRLESDGVIAIKSKFDHESKSLFQFIVYDASTSISYQVEIHVIDVNDNYPTFPASSVTLVISEASQVGSKFDIGSATDQDSSPFNVKGYRILSGNSEHYFRVDTRRFNGFLFADLIVNKTLNREEEPVFRIVIEAFDGGLPPKTGIIRVQVDISDVNDNAPSFDLSRYTVAVREDSPIGTDIITMVATDSDTADNGKVTYRIDRTNSDPDMFFVINSESGVISLNKRLDYEQATQHKIVVEAVDGGTEPQVGSTVVIVTVDNVNDNLPILNIIFLDANQSKISEAAQIGDYLARVSVSDPDSEENPKINLTLTGGKGRFGLSPVTNDTYLIVVQQQLNRETDPYFDITLTAQDDGSRPNSVSASFTITIEDVNDNPPRFSSDYYNVTLESTLAGSFVTQVQATDADAGLNAEIKYSLSASNQSNWFAINPSSGLITTRQVLNPAVNPSPQLFVVATDRGSPPMSATTTVEIELAIPAAGSLSFEESLFSFSVAEDAANRTCIGQLRVTNRASDSALHYSVVSSTNLPFEVRSETGDVCVTSSLDRETRLSYEFLVQVRSEASQSAQTMVRVTVSDVNEHSPAFHPTVYLVNVKRNVARGFPVTQVTATDADNYADNRIAFEITTGNEEGRFELDPDSGQLSVNKSLHDLEIGSGHDVTVVAVDERGLRSDQNALIVITILDGDSEEEGPTFSSAQYHFTIVENAPVASDVGSVEAFASDGSSVRYQIQADPPITSLFLIDSTSGELIVDAKIDREIFANLTFRVVASSGIPPLYSFAFVTVNVNDVNDNSPHFYGSSNGALPPLTVPYTLEVGMEIERISAIDDDAAANGTVVYHLSSPYFEINSSTGSLRLSVPLQPSSDYELSIESRDLGQPPLTSAVTQVIRARPPDPNCPVLPRNVHQFQIPENLPLSKMFGSIDATSPNPSATFVYFLAGTTSVPFALFPNGSLYLDRPLDYELDRSYQFMISIRGFPSSLEFERFCFATCDVIVTVEDVNDNAPRFSRPVYDFHVTEGLPPDSEVGRVHAVDRDSPANAHVTYRLALRSVNFDLDSDTGVITTLKRFDRRATSRFTIVVEATDDVNLAQATVHVYVDDVNDNFPQFLSETLRFAVILADSDPGTWVADMTATDDDTGSNSHLSYTIAGLPFFAIDRNIGTVSTRSAFPDSSLGVHTLSVTASDHGTPTRSSSVTLKVNVRPPTSNPSQYSDTQFVFTPMEDVEVGSVIGSFGSTSPSRRRRSVTSLPVFRAVGGSGRSYLAVNETTGDVVLKRKLQFSVSPQSTITVEKRTLADTVKLNGQINIRDTNDHAPVFASGTLFIGVDENAQVGKQIWQFVATDDDAGLNGQVEYSLVSQAPRTAFEINPDTGALLVSSVLDREDVSEYLLIVQATDSSLTSSRFSTVSCIVTVRDVNDVAPHFVNAPQAYVTEDEPIGFCVTRFIATDPDAGANGHVTYSLASPDQDFFHLDSESGRLTLARKLDYERIRVFSLNVSATDGAVGNPLITFQNFTIHVINVNDLSPRFERLLYQAEVAEEQSPGAIVTRVKAIDGDAGASGTVRYFLQSTSDFDIDSKNGVITTAARLDREEKTNFLLTAFAVDNATTSRYGWTTINVTVTDVNDNDPMFSPLDRSTDPPTLIRLEVPENSSGFDLIHVFAAHDLDFGENAKITYSIEGGNEDNDFILNSTTGQLYTARGLDREKTGSYRLMLVATDHGEPSRTAVGQVRVTVLDLNDNPPMFSRSNYEANVTESLSKGQYVVSVQATDPDQGLNGALQYFFAPTSGRDQLSGSFEIDVNTGLVTTAAVLDREQKALYHLLVVAVDSSPYNPLSSTCSLTVHVLDVNDNTPTFDESVVRLNVSRDTRPVTRVGQVTARDDDVGNNALISYSASNSNGSNSYFAINSSTGDIELIRPLGSLQSYSLIVIATDQGNPRRSSEAIVIVSIEGEQDSGDLLEFELPFYDVSIWENVQRQFPVVRVRAFVVGGGSNPTEITYRILRGNEHGEPFSISQYGAITVSNPSGLDFETKPNISLLVMAYTPTTPTPMRGFTTVNVHLRDDNDNHPRCSQTRYFAPVWEEQEASIVTQVFATDADSEENGDIRFGIASGDTDNVFSIDSVTGILRTNRNLDREIHDKYELVVHVTDLSETRKTGSCTVQIDVVDVNDHAPTLVVPPGPVRVPEDAAVGGLVTTVTANDVDADPILTFSLSPSNESFNIDRYGGEIFLTSSLDFETSRRLNFTIEASDGSKTVSSPLQIIITDVNDNRPTFDQPFYHILLNESSPIDTPIVTIRATDPDSDDNGRISYRILNVVPKSSLFKIDRHSGVVSANRSIVFIPGSSLYNLEVEALDHGHPVQSELVGVQIEIIDINNNPPRFAQPSLAVSIPESAPRGSFVINLTATDDDFSTENTNLYYEIVAGNVGGAFTICTNSEARNKSVGVIRTAHALDRELRDSYGLIVTAFDLGTPQLSSNVSVRVVLLNVDDHTPRFNSSLYRGTVRENDEEADPQLPASILSVCATDADRNDVSNLKFEITSGNDENVFELRPCVPPVPSCDCLFARVIDFETMTQYRMTVQVSDQLDASRSSIAQVIVDVENVNEHHPVVVDFRRVVIDEAVPAGQTLFYIHASDDDEGEFGHITYNVTNEGARHAGRDCLPPADMFVVEDRTGAVRAVEELDYENCRMLYFEVGVCDPDRCSSTFVELLVTPVDEFPPQFMGIDGSVGFYFFIPYGSRAGHIVAKVNATDQDSDEDGRIHFFLQDSSGSNLFLINPLSGVITLSRDLDTSTSHVLLLTAESTNQRSTTHVTVAVTGAPLVAPTVQVLLIVVGIISGLICIILIILAVKHKRNKRAYKDSSDSIQSNKDDVVRNGRQMRSDKFHNFSNNRSMSLGTAEVIGHQKNGDVIGLEPDGHYQLHDISSNKKNSTEIGKKNATTAFNNDSSDPIDPDALVRHHSMKTVNRPTSGSDATPMTESDVSGEDEEVTRITSTPSSSCGRSTSGSFVTPQRVADSGIQQDMDKASDKSEPRHNYKNGCEFDVAAGDGFRVTLSSGSSRPIKANFGGAEEYVAVESSHPPRSRNPRSDFLPHLDSFEEHRHSSTFNKSGSSDWKPEFESLSSVFTEIARLHQTKEGFSQSKHSFRAKPVDPPPLLTSVPPLNDNLSVPVPKFHASISEPHMSHQENISQNPYFFNNKSSFLGSQKSPYSAAPPLYSHAISTRPGSGASSRASRSSQRSHTQITSFPFNVSNFPPSMPRAPNSYHSSITSPAMSPSLSPSLSPLTTSSPPPVETIGKRGPRRENGAPSVIKVIRAQSGEAGFPRKPKERMVRV